MKVLILAACLLVVSAVSALAQDVCAPAKVTTVATTSYYASIQISWTATGDDCNTGNASTYEVRYSSSNITDTNWQSASVLCSDVSATNGNQNTCCLTTGCPGIQTYYFAVFLIDDAGNRSPLSNVVTGANRCSGAHTVCE
jgi:predicted phage tail protein